MEKSEYFEDEDLEKAHQLISLGYYNGDTSLFKLAHRIYLARKPEGWTAPSHEGNHGIIPRG